MLPRAQRRRNGQKVQNNTKPVNQANMTYVSDTGDPNDAVRQSVYDNTQQRIEAMSGAQGNPQTIDVQGKGLAPTYGQRQVPQATPLPTAAPTTQAPVQPQQLAASKTGVVQVPQGKPISTQDNGKVSDMVKDKNLTYNDMLAMLTDQKAAEEKRIRREKQAARIATIGQGLSSLANLYYTTKGAPSAFTPELSERMRTKYDQLTKDRTANDRAYLQSYITMLERQRNDARIRQRNEITNNYYKTKGDLETEKQRNEAALKQQAQEFTQKIAQEKLDETKLNNRERNKNAEERNNIYKESVNKRGTSSKSGGGSGRTWSFIDADGITHTYNNKAEYDADVKYYGKKGGVTLTEDKTSISERRDDFGSTNTTESTSKVNKSTSSVAAELKEKADENKAAKERSNQAKGKGNKPKGKNGNGQAVKRQAKHPI